VFLILKGSRYTALIQYGYYMLYIYISEFDRYGEKYLIFLG